MFKYFTKLSVRNQLVSLLSIMLVTTVALSVVIISNHTQSYFENKKLGKAIQFSVTASALMHELQKERGMTAGFINSSGEKFATELPKQREATNEKKDAFTTFIETTDVASSGSKLNDIIDSIAVDIKKIDTLRSKASSLSITATDAVGSYTAINKKIISAIATTQSSSENSEILLQLSAYTNFLQSKERAGLERAVGAGGFAAGFAAKDVQKLNNLVTTQNIYFNAFQTTALPQHIELLRSALNDTPSKDVNKMRNIARKSIATGDLGGVDAGKWFKTITKKIEALKSIEDKLSGDLIVSIKKETTFARNYLLILSSTIICLLLFVVSLANNLSSGLNACFSSLKKILASGSHGDFTTRIINIKSEGEIREVQELANTFMDQSDVFVRESRSSMSAVSKEEYYRKMLIKGFRGSYFDSANAINDATSTAETKAMELKGLMSELEETVKSVVNDTSRLANNMKGASSDMLSSSTNSVTKSDDVESAASTAQGSSTTVAAAVEEMSASIGEISSQTTNSLSVVENAQSEIENVSVTVQQFGSEVDGISNVVDLIKDIAEQTNLLALNATIEAARAGDAGKGFAVVASEVKNLAAETAKATEQITTQIEAIQHGSSNIVTGVNNISETMVKVAEISNAISAAVEEQSAVTQEISGNMQRTSENVDEVKNNIVSIKTALEETATSASEMSEMTENVSSNIVELDEALNRVINRG